MKTAYQNVVYPLYKLVKNFSGLTVITALTESEKELS